MLQVQGVYLWWRANMYLVYLAYLVYHVCHVCRFFAGYHGPWNINAVQVVVDDVLIRDSILVTFWYARSTIPQLQRHIHRFSIIGNYRTDASGYPIFLVGQAKYIAGLD